MMKVPILLIHPPVAKPSEPPAGVARLAGALRARQVACKVIDANIEGMTYLLNHSMPAEDTWSRRAYRHRDLHLAALRRPDTYTCSDAYRRAVADVNRLLAGTGASDGIRVGLADYRDSALSPVRSADLRYAARHPEKNPFHAYYRNVLLPRIFRNEPAWVGLSINFLSQALCAFALIGLLKQTCPNIKLIAGGGLITSWMQRPGFADAFSNLVDHMAAGPGEAALLKRLGCRPAGAPCLPDYRDLMPQRYLSPGFILPFSASAGCWWRRCAFCPEQAERQPFRPLPHTEAVRQLGRLCRQTAPVLIHLLDNAVSPALLKALTANPPGAPWYGFVRIGAPLDDAAFCKRLAAAGCAMLQIGLESGHQPVLDRLNKGVRLETAHRVLDNLR
ncbi:MAG: radical SAM protein, partial [Desulfatitalea sp.]|nr:radical SAM protein [Desulfatitalea sp.]NNJ99414.1 radical SAM protein [Desulfatitalea sp.]